MPGYKAGGPIKSLSNLCDTLKVENEVTVITSTHDFNDSKPFTNVEYDKPVSFNDYKVLYLSSVSVQIVKKTIDALNPDVIYLNSFFSYFTRIVLILKYFGNKILTYMQGYKVI